MLAAKEKKAETIEQPIEEIDIGFVEVTDLQKQQEQTERIKDKISRLQIEVQTRRNNFEVNLRQLRRDRDEKIAGLRNQYDACLNRGDVIGADKILDEIRKVRAELVNLAQNVLDSDSDINDLKGRQDELRIEIFKLYELAEKNLERAKQLTVQTSGLLTTISISVGHDFFEIERTVEQSKKLAEIVLAE